MTPFHIRTMMPADLPDAMQLSGQAGWNQTEADWAFFLRVNAAGCFAAVCGEKLIGTTMAIRYAHSLAWIGMVLVDPDHRRQGIASQLMRRTLEHLNDVPCIKLDASVDGKKVYDGLGFRDEYQLVRLMHPAVPKMAAEGVIPMTDAALESILALDARVFGTDRGELLRRFHRNAPQSAFVLRDGSGFCVGRPGRKQHQIGPVIAATTADAQALIASALSSLAGKPVVLDVLMRHTELIAWLESLGFAPQRVFQRMYWSEGSHANTIEGDLSAYFAIAAPEVG